MQLNCIYEKYIYAMKYFIVTTLLCCITFCATAQKNEIVEYPFSAEGPVA